MTAHELARILLQGADDPVLLAVTTDAAGWLTEVRHDPGGRTVDLFARHEDPDLR